MAETRLRIAAAAVDLHSTVGPARATISAVAARAGVERHTVYRHFPDELSLFRACVAHGLSRWPLPDPARWTEIEDPARRLGRGLEDLYLYFERTERMWTNVSRDLALLPALVQANAPVFAHWSAMRSALLAPWRPTGAGRVVGALIGHFLSFSTWRSLARDEGLSRRQVIDVAVAAVERASRRSQGRACSESRSTSRGSASGQRGRAS